MKITKQRLQQIIKEELQNVFAEQETTMEGRRLNADALFNLLKMPGKTWGAYDDIRELKDYTLEVWAQLYTNVLAGTNGWNDQSTKVHGCEINSQLPECGVIKAVIEKLQRDFGPLAEQIEAGLDKRAQRRFTAEHSNKIREFMMFVPAGKNPKDFMKSKGWKWGQQNAASPGYEDDDL